MEIDRHTVEAVLPNKSGSANQSEEENRAVAGKTGANRKKRFEVDIFRDWCKCCGICAAFCPSECIRLDEDGAPTSIDSDRCTGCGWCELHCPDFAISVHEESAPDKTRASGGARCPGEDPHGR